jgi:hypothetical protein
MSPVMLEAEPTEVPPNFKMFIVNLGFKKKSAPNVSGRFLWFYLFNYTIV